MSKNQPTETRPWMKFYPADWQSDEGLGQCSLMARGLWIELIAIMHKSEIYGHLLISGHAPTERQLANQVKTSPSLVKKALKELEEWGVFSRTKNGIIFCRRMVTDFKKDQENRQNGKNGGNPNLRKGVNHAVNHMVNPEEKTRVKAHSQRLDDTDESSLCSDSSVQPNAAQPPPMTPQRPARPPCRSSPPGAWYPLCDSREIDSQTGIIRGVVGGYYLDLIADEVGYAAQMRPDWGGDWTPLIAWLRDGIDPNTTIAPAIREIAKRPGYRPPASLRYFDNAIRDAHARQPRPLWRAA